MIDTTCETIVTIPKLAKNLDVSTPTVWRWVLSGELESIKLGNARRTSLEAGQRFVEQRNRKQENGS